MEWLPEESQRKQGESLLSNGDKVLEQLKHGTERRSWGSLHCSLAIHDICHRLLVLSLLHLNQKFQQQGCHPSFSRKNNLTGSLRWEQVTSEQRLSCMQNLAQFLIRMGHLFFFYIYISEIRHCFRHSLCPFFLALQSLQSAFHNHEPHTVALHRSCRVCSVLLLLLCVGQEAKMPTQDRSWLLSASNCFCQKL